MPKSKQLPLSPNAEISHRSYLIAALGLVRSNNFPTLAGGSLEPTMIN